MSEQKKVRLIKSSPAEMFGVNGLTKWRVEQLAPGIDYFTVAGFNTLEEAKAYRSQLLKDVSTHD